MYLSHVKIKNHPILGDIDISLINPKTKKPYSTIAFVGENGCGKTTILKELFDYPDSKYLVEKEKDMEFDALYLQQGSLHHVAMREIRKIIDDSDIYALRNHNGYYYKEALDNNVVINNKEEALKLINFLGDETIYKLLEEDHVGEVYCSQEVSEKIDGVKHGYNITTYSSGQQEILLKLKDIRTISSTTNCVLLDEPETSLHPRWQKDIVKLIRMMCKNKQGEYPQMFLATHSEKVLQSIIENEDALIVRLYKENGRVQCETILKMDLCLPEPTFAELDYFVFHIPSMDYHDQLFTYFGSFYNKDTSTAIDLKIEKNTGKIYGKAKVDDFRKPRTFFKFNKMYVTKMLPTYIRDFFHHPNEIQEPTPLELEKSINLLRDLVKFIKNKPESELDDDNE